MWGLIDGKDVKLNESDAISMSTYAKRKNQAMNFILQSLFNNQLFVVERETTTKGLYGKHSKNGMWTKSFDEHIVLDKKILHLPNGSKQ